MRTIRQSRTGPKVRMNAHPTRHPAAAPLDPHTPALSPAAKRGAERMNHLYYGDNLRLLREQVADASVDLVYLDPPFNSNAS